MTLRKSLVTDVSYGLAVGTLIAPSITRESILAAQIPARSMSPVTVLYDRLLMCATVAEPDGPGYGASRT